MSKVQFDFPRLRTLFLLLASTMTIMAGATLAPALPGMQKAFTELAYAEFLVKFALSLPGLTIAICAPFFGRLLDRTYKKSVLIIALVFYAISGVIGYFYSDSIMAILVSRLTLGAAVAAIMVACTVLAGEYFKGPKLGQYMGLQAAFGGFGGVIFLSIAGILAEQSWTYVFLIYLFALVILPGIMSFLYEPNKQVNMLDKAGENTPVAIAKNSLFLCYTFAALEVIVLYCVTMNLPFMLQKLNLGSSLEAGWVLALLLLAMSVFSLLYAKISLKLSIFKIHFIGWLLISIGLVVLSQSFDLALILSGSLTIGIGLGMIRPNLFIWLFSFTPLQVRGKVIGGITTCFFLGQFVSAFITEPLVLQFGYHQLFLIIGVAGLITLLLVAIKVTIDNFKSTATEAS